MCIGGQNLDYVKQLYADNVVCKESPEMARETTSGKKISEIKVKNGSKTWKRFMPILLAIQFGMHFFYCDNDF